MTNFKKEFKQYGEQLREEKCPLSDAELDRAIRHAIWQEPTATTNPRPMSTQHKWRWVVAAACIAALLIPLTKSITNNQKETVGNDIVFVCNTECNSNAILSRLNNIVK